MGSAPHHSKQSNMNIKTYGVPELTEWHGKVKAGSIEVGVSFTGGTSSPSGAQPAYLVTKDPIVQFVIEHSKEFRNGFIILLMSQETPGNHPREAVAKPKATGSDKANGADGADKSGSTADKADEANGADKATGADSAPKTVEVSCLQDAQAYLQEHFSIASYKVRTCEAAQQAGLEHGVRFSGGKFDSLDNVDTETETEGEP